MAKTWVRLLRKGWLSVPDGTSGEKNEQPQMIKMISDVLAGFLKDDTPHSISTEKKTNSNCRHHAASYPV